MLRVESLVHDYGAAVPVVNGLSLHLEQGEIGCLLGGSGCGKTTVLRCVAGFEKPSGGEIYLRHGVVSSGSTWVSAQQRRVGMVFQDYALFPHLTVEGNVGFALTGLRKTERKQQVEAHLELVGLSDMARRYPHELSGGQQQRVALARALAARPDLLLLDEPFSNLDVELREQLGQEVRNILKSRQVTALMVTHDQKEAFAMADKVGVMESGQLLQWATPYALYHEPVSRRVAEFIGEGVFIPGAVLVSGEVETELGLIGPECCPLHVRPGDHLSVLLRPDDIIHDDAAPCQATVLAKAFRGAHFLYRLALTSGQEVLSLVPSHHDHALGERIGIRLEAEHLVAFPSV